MSSGYAYLTSMGLDVLPDFASCSTAEYLMVLESSAWFSDGPEPYSLRILANMLDKDGGERNWKSAGRVKRLNNNHRSALVMCLARV